jgi:signal transduction histidine kinase
MNLRSFRRAGWYSGLMLLIYSYLYIMLGIVSPVLISGIAAIICCFAIGHYCILRNAFKPIQAIRLALENISVNNMHNHLAVKQTGDEVEELTHTLNRMIHHFNESFQQTIRFTADASHELRTPLTIMRGELESIIFDPSLPPEIQERIGSVLEETTRLAQITEGLFSISRLDAGEARMRQEVINFTTLARLTLEQLQLLAVERNITVSCNTTRPYYVLGDPSRLKQIIVNLLDNAIKYTPDEGAISLKVRASHKKLILEVTDNGIGIADKDLPHIFERFYRTDKARSRDMGGAGLGLSIVRSICLAHDGDIHAEQVSPHGTRFIVELPLLANNALHKQAGVKVEA